MATLFAGPTRRVNSGSSHQVIENSTAPTGNCASILQITPNVGGVAHASSRGRTPP
jgi:hypothetical protein